MAVNISLTNIDSFQNETTAIAAFTANNEAIINAFEDCVALDGTSPNQMLNILDMNSQQIVNLPQPSTANSPLRLQDLNSFIGGGSISVVPSGGSTGEALSKEEQCQLRYGVVSERSGYSSRIYRVLLCQEQILRLLL